MKSNRFFDRGVWCCATGAGSLLARAFLVALLGLVLWLLGRSQGVADSEPAPASSVTESTEAAQDVKLQSVAAKTPESAKLDSAVAKSDSLSAEAIPEHPDFHK